MPPFPPLRCLRSVGRYYVWLNKRRVYLGSDPVKAQVAYERMKAEHGSSPPPLTSSGPTVRQVCNAYLAEFLKTRPEQGTVSRVTIALQALWTHCGDIPATSFKAKALKQFRDTLLARQIHRSKDPSKPPKPISRNYVNKLVARIKIVWEWAAGEELISAEVAASVRIVKQLRAGQGGRETEGIAPVPIAVVEATLPYLPRPVAGMVRLQMLTGMRPGAACSLRRADLATTTEEKVTFPGSRRSVSALLVDSSLVWLYVPRSHKTLQRGKPLAIALGPKAQAEIRPFLEDRPPDAYCFSPREVRSNPTKGKRQRKERYTADSYAHAVKQCLARANRARAQAKPPLEPLPHWHPNQLRHLMASETSEATDRSTAAAMLGHAGVDVIDVYCEQELRKAAKAAAVLG